MSHFALAGAAAADIQPGAPPAAVVPSLVTSDSSPRQRRLALGFAVALLAIKLTSGMLVGARVPAINGPGVLHHL